MVVASQKVVENKAVILTREKDIQIQLILIKQLGLRDCKEAQTVTSEKT